MRNQTSFRLTTTLLPSDTTAKTTQVINKLDSTGAKFYPTFTEETVVITNDDRTIMETTRAVCTDGVLTFVKRGLSDDDSETPVDNRKLTWNPGSLCFITAGAGDWIDKDDDIVWSGDQTYTGSATYKGELITEKGVKYPHFDNVAALEAYSGAFGGMFAVVDSTGELYRYNAVTEERALIESSQPANPEMADDETIGTVRIATDAEFAAGTDTGSQGEYLVATPSQILGVSPDVDTKLFSLVGNDAEVGQEILDFILGGGVPIIEYRSSQSSKPTYLYFASNRSGNISFYSMTFYFGGIGLRRDKITILYSGTTLSSIAASESTIIDRFFLSSADLTKAQSILDDYESGYPFWVESDYNGSGTTYTYFQDKDTGSVLTLSTLGGAKHINISYNSSEQATAITFS